VKSRARGLVLLTGIVGGNGYFEKVDKIESLVPKTLCNWEQLFHLAACPVQWPTGGWLLQLLQQHQGEVVS
jgi:hypothetical protein